MTARTFASLHKHRNYRIFFAGQVVSNIGTWMQRIAQAWLVLELTHSPVALGVVVLCQYLPFTLFGLFSGVLVDRLDARRTVIATQAASMLLAAAMAALALAGVVEVWHVAVIAFLMGTALVLDANARQALTYQMVGREELSNAVALNASVFNGARIVGPAVAGVVIAVAGVGVCFALNAASFVAVLGGLLAMRVRELQPVERRERPTLLRGTGVGLAYARRDPRLLATLLGILVLSVVCFNFHVLLPVLAAETLDAGARTFGIISAFFGAGALLGGLATAFAGQARLRTLLASTAALGLCELVLAPERSIIALSALLFVTGAAFTILSSSANSIVQLAAPDHLRGRLIGVYYYAFAGMIPLGGLLQGWLCDIGGTRLSFLVGGGTCLAVAAAGTLYLSRALPAHLPLTKAFTKT